MSATRASWLAEHARLEALARSIEPTIRLTTKDGWPWRALAVLAAGATLGGMPRRRFLEDFATTLGPYHGYPAAWSAPQVESLLVHEARHTWQARMCGLGLHPWLGMPLFALLYLAVPLPAGLAFVRLWFELDADRAAWRWLLRSGREPEVIRHRARSFGTTVCSGAYGWALTAALGVRLFERAAERVLARESVDASR